MIKYTISELRPNIFAVFVPNREDRALLFLRASEFYESRNPEFRRKTFSISDFNRWYSINKYVEDWDGYNIPYNSAKLCYEKLDRHPELYTNYDVIFAKILSDISKKKSKGRAIIIGTDYENSQTTRHELYHALFYLNSEYRDTFIKMNNSLPSWIKTKLTANVKRLGYLVTTKKKDKNYVMNDEMQAYILSFDYSNPVFMKGIDIKYMKIINVLYHTILDKLINK